MRIRPFRKRRRLQRALAIIPVAGALLAVPPAWAATAPGSLDTSFGQGGSATVALGSNTAAVAVAVQPDGKIVTAGASTISGRNVIVAVRMLPSGALDPSFGVNGITTVSINGGAFDDSGAALALEPDGKIVIAGGGRTAPLGPIGFAAVRLLPDGTPDPNFGQGGSATVAIGTTAIAQAVVVQPDGKIVLGGVADVGEREFAAARLNANGTVDTSFGNAGITTIDSAGAAWGMVIQPDGRLILAGQASSTDVLAPTAQQFMAARLNTDGTLDGSFGQGGIVKLPVGQTVLGYGVALQPDGKVLLTGPGFTTTGVAITVRLNPNGSLDPSFGTDGISTFPDWYGVNGIVLDPQGRIVLPTVGAGAIRLSPDGSADTTFGTAGNSIVKLGTSGGGANGAAIEPDGKILLAGAASIGGQGVMTVIRLNGGTADAAPESVDSPAAVSPPPPATASAKPAGSTTKRRKRKARAHVDAARHDAGPRRLHRGHHRKVRRSPSQRPRQRPALSPAGTSRPPAAGTPR
jgi:uncharacterized delta-60 repeat protein